MPSEAGSYTFTGNTVALKRGYVLACGSGSYSFTGNDVSLKVGRRLVADSGAFNFTGNNVSLLFGRTLTAGAGSFTLTGNDVTFRRTYVLASAAGSFTFTGNNVSLTRGLRLVSDAGSYNFTGNNIELRKGFSIVCGSGSFTFTGNDISFPRTYRIAAGSGSFIFTGSDVDLRIPPRIFLDPGSFVFTGLDVNLIYNPLGGGGGTIIRGPELSQGGDYYNIYLNAGASSIDSVYKGCVIVLTDGTGAEQSRLITAYNGTTKKAKVAKIWSIRPDATTEYVLVPKDSGYLIRSEELAQGATFEAIYLNASASSNNNTYVGALLTLTDGPGADQVFRLKGYSGTTKKAAIHGRFREVPTSASSYILSPNNDERY